MRGRPFCNKNWTNGKDYQIIHPERELIHPEFLTGAPQKEMTKDLLESREQGTDPSSPAP